jgi:glucose-6-phosphate dehydrogenase assembly protein OpcA
MDLPPHERVTSATVTGASDSPSTDLLAGWLSAYLEIPVRRLESTRAGSGIYSALLERPSGNIEIVRPDGKVGTLTQPGQPSRRVALQRRSVRDCLAEELRRLDPDEVYAAALRSLAKVVKGRTPSPKDEAPAAAPAEATNGAAPKKSKAKAGS